MQTRFKRNDILVNVRAMWLRHVPRLATAYGCTTADAGLPSSSISTAKDQRFLTSNAFRSKALIIPHEIIAPLAAKALSTRKESGLRASC